MTRTLQRRVAAASAAALALGLALSGCGAANEQQAQNAGNTTNGLSGTLNGAGSSAQEAAFGAWQAGFQTSNPDVTVNYDPVGSGGGREQFIAGGTDFAGSDAYMTDEEISSSKDACNGVEAFDVPSYVSPIAVVYNLDGVDKLQLSSKTLASIFAGKITTWDDPAIKADNPDASLPGDKVTPVHRSDDSGTTDNFTDYLSKAAGDVWTDEPAGVWPIKSGEGAQGTSGVIDAVTNGAGTIGYADQSQAGNLTIAKIKVGNAYVAPSAESAAKVVDVSPRAKGRPGGDIAVDVARDTTESGAYPIVLVSYVIACPTYADKAKAELVKKFLGYVVSGEGQKAAAKAAGSAPLSSSLSQEAAAQINKISAKS